MRHSLILWFFAASSFLNSTSLTSNLSWNHGPSSGSSTVLKKVIFGRCLSETQYSDFDGWTRRIGGQLLQERHIWQLRRRRCGQRWEGLRHRGCGGGCRMAQVSIAQTQSTTFSTESFMVGWSVIMCRGEHLWPTFSPDLSPLDYYFWGFANADVWRQKPTKAVVKEVATSLNGDVLCSVKTNFRKRAETCLTIEGGHFEYALDPHN